MSSNSSDTTQVSRRQMERILDGLRNNDVQKTTRRTYHNVWTNFNKFIIRLDDIPHKWETRVSLYCAYLIEIKRLQSATVKSYISAIKKVLIEDGYEWSNRSALLNAITRSCKIKYDRIKTRLPIRRNFLELIVTNMRRKFRKQIYLMTLYTSAVLLCYYGMLRVGEVAQSQHSIKAVDVHDAQKRSKLLLVLHSSKTHGPNTRPQEIEIIGKGEISVKTIEGNTNFFEQKTEWSKILPS